MQDTDQQKHATDGSTESTLNVRAANEPVNEINFAADLEQQLNDALGEAAKLKDALLRAAADNDNMRKRAQADVANAHKFSLEGFAGDLLSVKDSLDAALTVEAATLESYRNGVELTLKQLVNVFSKFNITEINPVGDKFDPHRHQAMTMVDSDQDPNTVVAVMQKGYALNERILRPALVTVARPRSV